MTKIKVLSYVDSVIFYKKIRIKAFFLLILLVGFLSETYSQPEEKHEIIRFESLAGISEEGVPVSIEFPEHHSVSRIIATIEFEGFSNDPNLSRTDTLSLIDHSNDSLSLDFNDMTLVVGKIDTKENKSKGIYVNILGVKNSKAFYWYGAEKLKKKFLKKGAWIIKSLIIESEQKPKWFDSKIDQDQYPVYQVQNLLLDAYEDRRFNFISGFKHKLSVNTSIFLPDFGESESFRVKRLSYSDNCTDLAVSYFGEQKIGTSSESLFQLKEDEGKKAFALRLSSLIDDEVNSFCKPDLKIAFTVPGGKPIIVGARNEVRWKDYPELDSAGLMEKLVFEYDTTLTQVSPLVQEALTANTCLNCEVNGSAQLKITPSVWKYTKYKTLKKITLSGSGYVVQDAESIVDTSWQVVDSVYGRFLDENLEHSGDLAELNEQIKVFKNGSFFIGGLKAGSYKFQSFTKSDPIFNLVNTLWIKRREEPQPKKGKSRGSEEPLNPRKITFLNSELVSSYVDNGLGQNSSKPYIRKPQMDSTQNIIGYSYWVADSIYIKGPLPTFNEDGVYTSVTEWGIVENGDTTWNNQLYSMRQDPKEKLTLPFSVPANTNCKSEYVLLVDPEIKEGCLSKLRFPDPTVPCQTDVFTIEANSEQYIMLSLDREELASFDPNTLFKVDQGDSKLKLIRDKKGMNKVLNLGSNGSAVYKNYQVEIEYGCKNGVKCKGGVPVSLDQMYLIKNPGELKATLKSTSVTNGQINIYYKYFSIEKF